MIYTAACERELIAVQGYLQSLGTLVGALSDLVGVAEARTLVAHKLNEDYWRALVYFREHPELVQGIEAQIISAVPPAETISDTEEQEDPNSELREEIAQMLKEESP
jgi:hypothetical protein